MDHLYGLQFDRAIKCVMPNNPNTYVPANDSVYSTQMTLRLVRQ